MRKYILSIAPIAIIIGVFFHINITSAQDPAQIIGIVPTDYTTSATLEWTGGTLYQFKARLQTLGCTVDVVRIYNQEQDKWFTYSQYSAPHEDNQEFHNNYSQDYIPASTIQIPNCYDMCTFKYAPEAIERATTGSGRVWIRVS